MEVRTGPLSFQPAKPQISSLSEQNFKLSEAKAKHNPFHAIYKVPFADTLYGRAKHVQLVDKDPDGALAMFREAILEGDRVDSALKDMAVVLKQQNRTSDAIHVIKSFRDRCSEQAQESLDNVLIDLYKKCGMIDEQIDLLKHKLMLIQQGAAFNGKATKTARSHGKKFQLSIKQETTRLLGNLGWAYMQQLNYSAAEIVYRKAQLMDPDDNKACNLSVCLMKQGRFNEAEALLQGLVSCGERNPKSSLRAMELLKEIGARECPRPEETNADVAMGDWGESLEWCWKWVDSGNGDGKARRKHRLRVFEEITTVAFPKEGVAF